MKRPRNMHETSCSVSTRHTSAQYLSHHSRDETKRRRAAHLPTRLSHPIIAKPNLKLSEVALKLRVHTVEGSHIRSIFGLGMRSVTVSIDGTRHVSQRLTCQYSNQAFIKGRECSSINRSKPLYRPSVHRLVLTLSCCLVFKVRSQCLTSLV